MTRDERTTYAKDFVQSAAEMAWIGVKSVQWEKDSAGNEVFVTRLFAPRDFNFESGAKVLQSSSAIPDKALTELSDERFKELVKNHWVMSMIVLWEEVTGRNV